MPYKVVGGVRFYERREVRDALAYLRMLVNPADEISLRRILNTPKRGIGDRAEACVQALAERERITFWEALRRADEAPGLASRSLNAIRGLRRPGRGAPVDGRRGGAARRGARVGAGPLRLPRRAGGLRRPAGRDPGREPRRARGRGPGVLRRPRRRAVGRPGRRRRRHRRPGLADFLERVALVADADQIPDDPDATTRRRHPDDPAHRQGAGVPGRLPHRPRGRRLPAPRSLGDQPELEEERRLAYVGVTRARSGSTSPGR